MQDPRMDLKGKQIDVNLGVQVKYGDINNARVSVEIAFAQNGMSPEVSCGTHFFRIWSNRI